MRIFRDKKSIKQAISKEKSAGRNIGLVPTMGALHDGHLSLVEKALERCDRVVVSIFVNPTQFDNPEDLEKYPRTLEQDLKLLESFNAEIWVFSPSANELYDNNISSQHFDFEGLEKLMEGKYRTGHFDGVGTVVKHLFEIVKPDFAFFGEKDFQQLQIIRKLTEIEQIPVEIVACPILRETNGLARSSRNERLNSKNREKAQFIYNTLKEAKSLFGTKSATYIENWVETQFQEHPFLKLEYFEIAEEQTLKKIQNKKNGTNYRAFIAAYAEDIRLIDNVAL